METFSGFWDGIAVASAETMTVFSDEDYNHASYLAVLNKIWNSIRCETSLKIKGNQFKCFNEKHTKPVTWSQGPLVSGGGSGESPMICPCTRMICSYCCTLGGTLH